jgi:hypothetical protein
VALAPTLCDYNMYVDSLSPSVGTIGIWERNETEGDPGMCLCVKPCLRVNVTTNRDCCIFFALPKLWVG